MIKYCLTGNRGIQEFSCVPEFKGFSVYERVQGLD